MRHDLAIIHRNSMPEAFLLEYMLLPSRIHRQPKFHQHGHECLLISSDPQSPAWAKLVRSKLKYLYEQLLPMIERLSKERFWILQALLLLYTGWIFSVHCAISTAQNWKSQLSVASYVRMLYSAKALHESKSDFLAHWIVQREEKENYHSINSSVANGSIIDNIDAWEVTTIKLRRNARWEPINGFMSLHSEHWCLNLPQTDSGILGGFIIIASMH
jgi:hypothetical protein